MVSLPCWEWFEDQDDEYRAAVLPPGVPTLAVEAAASFGWDRYADDSVSIDTFGASAPGRVVLAEFGFTADNVVDRAAALVSAWRDDRPQAPAVGLDDEDDERTR